MAYAVGHISNPAVTLGLWCAGRCADKHVIPYMVVQIIGAVLGSGLLWLIAAGKPDWVMGGFATNGYGALSPGKYSMLACFVTELVLTFVFLVIIIGTTSKGAAAGFAGLPIGVALTLIHLISISGHQHLGQPGPQHRSRSFRRRRGVWAALAVLDRAGARRDGGRLPGPDPV